VKNNTFVLTPPAWKNPRGQPQQRKFSTAQRNGPIAALGAGMFHSALDIQVQSNAHDVQVAIHDPRPDTTQTFAALTPPAAGAARP
jgi:hypothetical protein